MPELPVIGSGRSTHRFEPATDIDLCMRFSTEVPSTLGIGFDGIPAMHGELSVCTANHKPARRVTGHQSANLAFELLNRRHHIPSAFPRTRNRNPIETHRGPASRGYWLFGSALRLAVNSKNESDSVSKYDILITRRAGEGDATERP